MAGHLKQMYLTTQINTIHKVLLQFSQSYLSAQCTFLSHTTVVGKQASVVRHFTQFAGQSEKKQEETQLKSLALHVHLQCGDPVLLMFMYVSMIAFCFTVSVLFFFTFFAIYYQIPTAVKIKDLVPYICFYRTNDKINGVHTQSFE